MQDADRRGAKRQRRLSPFRQSDVARAVKGVKAAGCAVRRAEIDAEGKIVIEIDNGNRADAESEKREIVL